MTFSQFTTHFLANRSRIAASTANAIRREALARVAERQMAGRGDQPLDFTDLINRIETALGA